MSWDKGHQTGIAAHAQHKVAQNSLERGQDAAWSVLVLKQAKRRGGICRALKPLRLTDAVAQTRDVVSEKQC